MGRETVNVTVSPHAGHRQVCKPGGKTIILGGLCSGQIHGGFGFDVPGFGTNGMINS